MGADAVRAALRDWADELEAGRKGTEFVHFARLMARSQDDAKIGRLGELMEFHASEEALG